MARNKKKTSRPQDETKSKQDRYPRKNREERGTNDSRKNNTRGFREEKNSSGALTVSGYSNDPNWYKRVGLLAIDSSNISTYTPNGLPYPVALKNTEEFTPSGILRLDYIPTFGDVSGVSSPLAVIARDLYDYVNARNSRSSSYDPNDLMLYCIGVANAWVLHAAVRRIIGMYNTYSIANRYWWDPVLESMNIAPINNTNDITGWVNLANRMALTLNTLAVPKGITYFDRAQFMCESVFADSPSSKASLYYFMPSKLLQYQTDDEGKGELVSVATPWNNIGQGRTLTPTTVETFFNYLIKYLINDTDISFMKADVRKAFGDENCYWLPQIDATFRHPFVYDAFVNLQTRNATIHNELRSFSYDLTQDMDTNTIKSTRVSTWIHEGTHQTDISGYFGSLYVTRPGQQVFDFPVDNVDNDMWIEATKLHAYFSGATFKATTEAIVDATTWIFKMVNGFWKLQLITASENLMIQVNEGHPATMTVLTAFMERIENASKFAAAPLLWACVSESGSAWSSGNNVYLLEDLTNFTVISPSDLNNQIDSSQLSLFSWRDLSK